MSAANILKIIKQKKAELLDRRFTEPRRKIKQLTNEVTGVDENMLYLQYQIFLGIPQLF